MPAGRLFLIDSFGFIFRAYHARARSGAPPMRTRGGMSTEAVYIFHNMVKRLLERFTPDAVAAVFESEGPTFREQQFAAYKANRAETPPDLIEQIPWCRKVLEALSIPVLESPGFEADDVIGTLARRAAAVGWEVTIVSADKDMLQLVGDRVKMLNPMKDDTLYDREGVRTFLGVYPEQVADLLALKGDAVDNIPGAPGIGDKGAVQILEQFGSLAAALDRAAEVQRKMYRESLQQNREQIELSKQLATIDCAVPLQVDVASLHRAEPDAESLRALYRELEFLTFLKELDEKAPAPLDCFPFASAEERAAWWAALPPSATLAVIDEAEEIGVAFEDGVGRSQAREGAIDLAGRPLAAFDVKALLEAELIENPGPIHDVLLYGFLLLAEPAAVSLDKLAVRYLDRPAGSTAAERATTVLALAPKLSALVDERGLRKVYDEIDLPSAPVLARMERLGIRVDRAMLAALSTRMAAEIDALTKSIHAHAGHEFNINSPQQLGKVLFEELQLPTGGRTGKGKAFSTAADVLEGLAGAHEIVRQVLEYRQLTKLQGTYVDALPELIRPETGRVHTTFNLAGAATGRLSSNNPNLQNIPVRTELGREIRAAFVPREGWTLVVADYSQIELRLLAHFSGDKVLVEAFRNGEDIHTRTASEVFGIAPLMVTPDMRRAAKAVNFGIVYGQTGFGLASALGIPKAEAERYIRNYFERYAGVKQWIDSTIREVRESGIARTLFGRERPIPDMQSKNPNARGFAERTAVNTPLQGTAADLIKLAMIRIDAALEAKWQARMLLQVHDELVLESPPEEVPELERLVKREMESVYKLAVPLIAETGHGPNWRDAK